MSMRQPLHFASDGCSSARYKVRNQCAVWYRGLKCFESNLRIARYSDFGCAVSRGYVDAQHFLWTWELRRLGRDLKNELKSVVAEIDALDAFHLQLVERLQNVIRACTGPFDNVF
jgi:hypothetical protein